MPPASKSAPSIPAGCCREEGWWKGEEGVVGDNFTVAGGGCSDVVGADVVVGVVPTISATVSSHTTTAPSSAGDATVPESKEKIPSLDIASFPLREVGAAVATDVLAVRQ
jgi:hypothetical protein